MCNVFPLFARHPDPHDRPDFSAVLGRLKEPSNSLLDLGISEAELARHPKSATLCASLKAGSHLFKALQNKYLEDDEEEEEEEDITEMDHNVSTASINTTSSFPSSN